MRTSTISLQVAVPVVSENPAVSHLLFFSLFWHPPSSQAAAEGKLVMSNKMAVAAYAGEEVTAVAKKSRPPRTRAPDRHPVAVALVSGDRGVKKAQGI